MSGEKPKHTSLGTLGEFGLIDRITSGLTLKQATSLVGVGDDAAVIDAGDEGIVVSTDMLVEGIHFDLMYHPLKHLGYKSVIVNLSDIYAMNAYPQQITVSLALSNRFSVEGLDELYEGIRAACDLYNVDLIGGDTCSSNKGLVISITAIGRAKKDKITYRSGAKVGDIICVSGDLGAAYLGLQILEREKQIYMSQPDIQPDLEEQNYLIERQLKPEARKDIIDYLAANNIQPTSMIDISDGLASELIHICKASGVGAFVEETHIPLKQESELMALKFQLDPVTCALSGGEDYELLFTAPASDLNKLKVMPDIYLAGEIVPAKDGITLHTSGGNIRPLKAQGWGHFEDALKE
jgi:thiamine-monophosphate kinase